jgi:hypothetical protein
MQKFDESFLEVTIRHFIRLKAGQTVDEALSETFGSTTTRVAENSVGKTVKRRGRELSDAPN